LLPAISTHLESHLGFEQGALLSGSGGVSGLGQCQRALPLFLSVPGRRHLQSDSAYPRRPQPTHHPRPQTGKCAKCRLISGDIMDKQKGLYLTRDSDRYGCRLNDPRVSANDFKEHMKRKKVLLKQLLIKKKREVGEPRERGGSSTMKVRVWMI
jgi:hypothetical protein